MLNKNFVKLQDDLFQISDPVEKIFYSVERTQTDLSDYYNDGTLLEVNFVIDTTFDYYERVVYSFLDMTGQVGGLYEVVKVVVGMIVTFFANKLFMFSIINKLYHIDLSDINKQSPTQLSLNLSRVHPTTEVTNSPLVEEIKSSNVCETSKTITYIQPSMARHRSSSI